MSTVAAPMVESKRSERPLLEATLRSVTSEVMRSASVVPAQLGCHTLRAHTWATWCLGAPLELRTRGTGRRWRRRSSHAMRGSAVTSAITVASEVLLGGVAHELLDVTVGDGAGHALRDSEIASSVPSRPSYFLVTVSRSTYRPSASSPTATETPPAPKSLQRLIRRQSVAAAEQTLQLALDGGVALLDLGARGLDGLGVLGLEEPVAPPMPSRPVRPPSRMILSVGGGALATNVVCRGSAHDGANLHALGHVTGVIEFVDLTGGKADLVAVAGVAGGGSGHELALRQLALERLGNRDGGVTGAGDTHGRY